MLKRNLLVFLFSLSVVDARVNDVTIVGEVDYKAGLGKTGYFFIKQLQEKFSVGVFYNAKTTPCLEGQDPHRIENSFSYSSELPDSPFYVYTGSMFELYKAPLDRGDYQNSMWYAYSVWEASVLPEVVVERLNSTFDAIMVADSFLIDVYKNSGVTKPLFCVPSIMYIERFLKEPAKEKRNDVFTFGCIAASQKRKNLKKLIMVFHELYGNNDEYCLKIHCKNLRPLDSETLTFSEYEYEKTVNFLQDIPTEDFGQDDEDLETEQDLIDELGITNIIISSDHMSEEEYIEYLKTMDCYILISKGEGFSLTPREALALGIPCILTDNTAQTTICKSGCVLPVACHPVTAWLEELRREADGYQYDCDIQDVKAAMQTMVAEYDTYLAKANCGRQWVTQYLADALKDQYLTFFAPHDIVLSDENKLDSATRTIYTDNFEFYTKMKHHLAQKH